MSPCRPHIICKQNILKHILSAFIAKKYDIHIMEYLIAKFVAFLLLSCTATLFIEKSSFSVTGRHLVMLGGELSRIFRDRDSNQIAQKIRSTCEIYAKYILYIFIIWLSSLSGLPLTTYIFPFPWRPWGRNPIPVC